MASLSAILWSATVLFAAMLPGTALCAQDTVNLRTAYLDQEGWEPAIVRVSDAFRARPDGDLIVFVYEHRKDTYHFNSVKDEVVAIDTHIRSLADVKASDMVAISQEKPQIRIFMRPPAGFEMEAFEFPRTSVRLATEEERETLAGISTEEFSAYFIEAYEHRKKAARFLLGDRLKGEDIVETRVQITAANSIAARDVQRTLKGFDKSADLGSKFERDGATITVTSQFEFNEIKVGGFYSLFCKVAQTEQAECTDWTMKVLPRTITLEDFVARPE